MLETYKAVVIMVRHYNKEETRTNTEKNIA